MTSPIVDRLFACAREHDPKMLRGLEAARDSAPVAFDTFAAEFLTWGEAALGADALSRLMGAYTRFTIDVNVAQARYEQRGCYEFSRFADAYDALYGQHELMRDYLWGVYHTSFVWPHHLDLFRLFDERFLPRASAATQLIELAPGHGGWGTWALRRLPKATLQGYDISSASLEIAAQVTAAAEVADRSTYTQCDALDLTALPAASGDALISAFLVEHLEEPEKLFGVIAHLLRESGVAFVTAGLTAAQTDHIFEFRHESELVLLAEEAGLRVLECRSNHPDWTAPGARFLPRSMGLILQKRQTDTW